MHGTAPLRNKQLELKLEMAPATLPALEKVPLLRSLKASPRKLRKNGMMLRVRRPEDRYVQTIKSASNSASFERGEWEGGAPMSARRIVATAAVRPRQSTAWIWPPPRRRHAADRGR